MTGLVLSNEWEKMRDGDIMTLFSYYICVFLEVPTKTNILIRIAGLRTQICPRDLGNKKQHNEDCAPCFTHDQYVGQSNNNEPIQCQTFEISAKIKYAENQNNTTVTFTNKF
jgi:hypothetical protein